MVKTGELVLNFDSPFLHFMTPLSAKTFCYSSWKLQSILKTPDSSKFINTYRAKHCCNFQPIFNDATKTSQISLANFWMNLPALTGLNIQQNSTVRFFCLPDHKIVVHKKKHLFIHLFDFVSHFIYKSFVFQSVVYYCKCFHRFFIICSSNII